MGKTVEMKGCANLRSHQRSAIIVCAALECKG